MKALKVAGTGVLVLAAGYLLVVAVFAWADAAFNQAQGGRSYAGQSAFDATIPAVLLLLVALTAVRARRGGAARTLTITAAIALPLSAIAIAWAMVTGMGF